MNKFIELTGLDGIKFSVNINFIRIVLEDTKGRVRIRIDIGSRTVIQDVKESYEELKTKLGAI